MLEYLVLYEFIVALLMGLGAFCAFLWAVSSGSMRNVEEIKHQVLKGEEGNNDRKRE